MAKKGRPTKYREEFPQMVLDYAYEQQRLNGIPFVEELAYKIFDVHKDTVYEWVKHYEDFSDSIKKLLAIQAVALQKGGISQKYSVPMSIFLLKNNHGMSDRTDITSGGEKLEGPVVYVPKKETE